MDLSVVIPVYNEADNVEPLHAEVHAVLEKTGLDYEVVFVDDGSKDETLAILERLASQQPRTVVIAFRRNFGQTAAMSAGFDHALGQVVVTMDGDRQNDPADIPKLLAKLDEGYDIAAGWRYDRQDAYLNRKLPSKLANGLISRITGVELHDYGCTLKAFRQEVVRGIRLYGEMHRFIPAIASHMGVRIVEVPVNHRPRIAGKTKYGIGRTPRVLLDLITVKFLLSYSTRPIQIFGRWGLISGALGFLLGLYYTILKLFFSEPMWGKPGVILAVLLMLVGVQLISLGLLGELQVRTYYETQAKPIYNVLRVIGRPAPTDGQG
ncbi:glycosyl transferase family 2 [Desulfarculus baarsii DSM 2075]|uniref:Glycosyl transferase family 2 n=1 Tax=Desulfarculus baarsii (strain ATCC 33931 / DSM 2075 / LMG 7858 / VKM B-1802 / 2st14) TaxID=644282 RepID=E1QEK0_DESB2|nr:glycosyltransferase family 2 protein [Desulfarculus baarsii]ADK83986.1 glycosyl transferase family 2 [Desulfarculus baarsii DSM 2075]